MDPASFLPQTLGAWEAAILQGIALAGAGWAALKWIVPAGVRVHGALAKVDTIYAELKPNGGASLRDAVDVLGVKVDVLSREHAVMAARQWAMVGAITQPTWESDGRGNCIRANQALLNMTGRSVDDLQGSGWENIVLPADRERVWAEWRDAVAHRRTFESEYRVINPMARRAYSVTAVATPFFAADGEVIGWIGTYSAAQPTAYPRRKETVAP